MIYTAFIKKEKLSQIALSCDIPSTTENSIETALKNISKNNDNAIVILFAKTSDNMQINERIQEIKITRTNYYISGTSLWLYSERNLKGKCQHFALFPMYF